MAKNSIISLLIVFFTVLYLFPLGGHPLFIPDETQYAEISREMVASGDWIVPRLNGLRCFEKPVMGHWLNAVSLSIFGENSFAVRLPAALSTGFTALLIFFLCVFCYGRDSRIPLLATFIYLSTLGVKAATTVALPDPSFTLFLTAALVMFFLAAEAQYASLKERIFLFTTGLFTGCAFLTGGFPAFGILMLVVVPYLLLQRRRADLFRMLVLPVIAVLLVSLPWSLLIYQQEPDFWHEQVHRFLSHDVRPVRPFYYFLLVLPATFMPWTMLLPAAAIGGFHNREKQIGVQRRLLIFCLCWLIFPFLFLTASSSKLPTFILPCFPPLVILFAHYIFQWLESNKEKRIFLQWPIGILIVLLSILFIVISALHLFGPERLWIFDRSWKWLLLVCAIGAMLLLLHSAFYNRKGLQKLILFGLSFGVLFFTVQFTIPTRTLNKKAPGPFLSYHAAQISPDIFVLSGSDVIQAVCWYLKRDDVYLVGDAGELKYGVEHEAGTSQRLLSLTGTNDFIQKHRGQVALIASLDAYSNYWQPLLPKPLSVESSGSRGYLLLRY